MGEGRGSGDVRTRLAARLRVCILGGTAFLNNESADLVKELASELHKRFSGDGVIFITCGQQGVQEAFAKGCGDGSLVRNLLAQGEICHFRAGQDIVAGRDADQVKKFFLDVGDVYITVEGGPGVAQDARLVMARNASVLALKRTGGASAGKFDFPQAALTPDFATEEQWELLCSSATPVNKAAGIAADLVSVLLQASGRASTLPLTLEMSNSEP